MKKIKYQCDVCGKDISPKCRPIPLAFDKTISSNPSFMRLKITQVKEKDNYPERELSMDLCDDCWEKLSNIILKEVKV